jgi:hypothetical protein
MGVFQKKDAKAALDRTRDALAPIETKLAELVSRRDERLLADDGVSEIEKLDKQIAALQSEAGIHRDKIAALEAQLDREAAERRIRERDEQIRQFEAGYAKLAELATELDTDLRKAVEKYYSLIQGANHLAASWPLNPVDLRLAMLTPPAIQTAIAEHLHNVGGSAVFIGGASGSYTAPSFPGAKKVGIESAEFLAEKFVSGAAYLSRIIRSEDEMRAA